MQDYIHKRRSGQRQSTVKSADLLSLFFESPEIFTDEDMIDEIMDFFAAGSGTTGRASITITAHFASAHESSARVRSEFESVCKQSENYAHDDKNKLSKL